jgi:hypothetical protein
MRLLSGPHLISVPSLHHRRYPDLNPYYVRLRARDSYMFQRLFCIFSSSTSFRMLPRLRRAFERKMLPRPFKVGFAPTRSLCYVLNYVVSLVGPGRKKSWRAICINHILEHYINSQHAIRYLKEKFSTMLPWQIQ